MWIQFFRGGKNLPENDVRTVWSFNRMRHFNCHRNINPILSLWPTPFAFDGHKLIGDIFSDIMKRSFSFEVMQWKMLNFFLFSLQATRFFTLQMLSAPVISLADSFANVHRITPTCVHALCYPSQETRTGACTHRSLRELSFLKFRSPGMNRAFATGIFSPPTCLSGPRGHSKDIDLYRGGNHDDRANEQQ